MQHPEHTHYISAGGIRINRQSGSIDYSTATDSLRRRLDDCRGVLLSSSCDYPGRYTQWDIGFINPPICITGRGRQLVIEALNARGRVLLPEMLRAVADCDAVAALHRQDDRLVLDIRPPAGQFTEEARSRQPSVFSVLRVIREYFHSDRDQHLGLYGAFGYDLAFQFESVNPKQNRGEQDRDLVLYLPDELVIVDHGSRQARRLRYDFICRREAQQGEVRDSQQLETTGGMKRSGAEQPWEPAFSGTAACDHAPGEYADTVREAIEHFRDGRLFEVVPGQVFHEVCRDSPARIFERLKRDNPAPYGALMNLGEQEYLVAASPEMYVRVQGDRVETCPISGTIARGEDAIADARQILTLLNSEKDEAELSMCTDVDRNDKSRVCVPGSVEVIGRRQVELYSRLIHTVDHVQGRLAPEYDALDAFLAHSWAVTVTGAPKLDAMQFIEDREKSPRRWYGGAMGVIGFDGSMNTGLTLRTLRIHKGLAEVRAGATLLADSDPEAEEAETRLKASALLCAVRGGEQGPAADESRADTQAPALQPMKVLMVDHRDSFVHNLGSHFRALGMQLETMRPDMARQALQKQDYDLVVLSPGPGRPEDFAMADTLALCEQQGVAVFGVCLGLQGIVEYFGGSLGQLDVPMHGKPSMVYHEGLGLFRDLPSPLSLGRYHSLHAVEVPDSLEALARTEDGVVMAVQHRELPLAAVQFHPESIMSLENRAGEAVLRNFLQQLQAATQANAAGRDTATRCANQ